MVTLRPQRSFVIHSLSPAVCVCVISFSFIISQSLKIDISHHLCDKRPASLIPEEGLKFHSLWNRSGLDLDLDLVQPNLSGPFPDEPGGRWGRYTSRSLIGQSRDHAELRVSLSMLTSVLVV